MGYICFLFNIVLPGTGTLLSSICGKNKGCRGDVALLGVVQLLTAPILLVGWIWSINHGLGIFEASKPEGSGNRGDGVENTMGGKELVKYACVKLVYEMFGTCLWTLLFVT